jgi:pilus assembly protein Flp/PilA
MKELLTRFIKDESGQGLVEYVLIIAVVAIGLILFLFYFRGKVGSTFKRVGDSLDNYPQQPAST